MDHETRMKGLEYRLAFTATIYFLSLLTGLELMKVFAVHCPSSLRQYPARSACQHFFEVYIAHPYFPAFVLDDLQGLQRIWWLPALVLATLLLPPYRRFTLLVLGPVVSIGAAAQLAPALLLVGMFLPDQPPWQWEGYVLIVVLSAWDSAVVVFVIRSIRLLWSLLYEYRVDRADKSAMVLRTHLVPRLLDYRIDRVLSVRDVGVIVWWHQIGPVALGLLILAVPLFFEGGRLHDQSTLVILQSTSDIGDLMLMVIPFSVLLLLIAIVVFGVPIALVALLVSKLARSIVRADVLWLQRPLRSFVAMVFKWSVGATSRWIDYPGRAIVVLVAVIMGGYWLYSAIWTYRLGDAVLADVVRAFAANAAIVPASLSIIQALRWAVSAARGLAGRTRAGN